MATTYTFVCQNKDGSFQFIDSTGATVNFYKSLGTDKTGALLLDRGNGATLKAYNYHRAQLAIDNIILNDDCILMIVRGHDPFRGCLALPGGFVDLKDNESVDDAADREKKEEVAGHHNHHRKRVTFRGNASRDPRGYTTSFVYLEVIDSREGYKAGDDAADYVDALFWIPVHELMALTTETAKTYRPSGEHHDAVCGIAFDHIEIIQEVVSNEGLDRRDDGYFNNFMVRFISLKDRFLNAFKW